MFSKFFRPLSALCFLLGATLLLAQFGASLQGTISDSSGAVVPNASVTITNNGTQRTQTTKAGGDGFFRFTGLPPGTYRLTTQAPNFNRQVTQDVIVDAEEARGIDITLEVGERRADCNGYHTCRSLAADRERPDRPRDYHSRSGGTTPVRP